jgi:hypothetical protein
LVPDDNTGTWTARQSEEIFLTGNSGRAVDWMGYDRDASPAFAAAAAAGTTSRNASPLKPSSPSSTYTFTRRNPPK